MKLADCESCTGCAACVNACQFGALLMRRDDEGFLYPVVDNEKCVGCGRCERVCPIQNIDGIFPPQVSKTPYCGRSLNEDVWRASASGGAFSEICFALDVKSPVVFGARFNGRDKVCHSFVAGVQSVAAFRKSKYVQSEVRGTLKQCKEFLDVGRFVIYSGTPCQIAGLRSFLGHDYENLVTIEFICHGVGSPSVFADSLKAMETKRKCVILDYQFRSKEKWPSHPYTSRYTWSDGKSEEVVVDLYNRFFLNQLCLRRSCMENCCFRREGRCADITLGDARGESRLYPNKDEKNWSVVIANTVKGNWVVGLLKERMMLRPYPLKLLEEMNPLYFHTTKGSAYRQEFFARYLKGENMFRIADRLDPRDGVAVAFVKRIVRLGKRLFKSYKE